jgi:hypothetical protein
METLIASFIWGTLGLAIFVYGKKRKEFGPFLVGLVLMILSYFLSAIWLTMAGILLLGVLWMLVRGYI